MPNIGGDDSIKWYTTSRRGRLCVIPPLRAGAPMRLQTLRDNSFAVKGPRLFNSFTADIRNFDGPLEGFKKSVDKYLIKVPHKPLLQHYYQRSPSNSIVDQMKYL